MPTVIFPEGLCFSETVTPQVAGCANATRFEWEVLDKPVGSSVSISNDQAETPNFDVSQDGTYNFRLCCFFDQGTVFVEPPVVEPELNCPLGVLAGSIANVQLTGCESGSITNVQTTGVATGATFSADGSGIVTTDVTMPGTATVSVDCTVFDADGNPTTTSLQCSFNVIPADTELVCSVAPVVEYNYVACGQRCECVDVTVVFACDDSPCEKATMGIVFKDCPPCPADPDCPPLERTPIAAGIAATFNDCGDPLCDDCDEGYCCEPDMPIFYWNNLCACPDWTMEAPAIEGSSVYNACNCTGGQRWCFEGSATIIMSGPPTFIDSLILWDHNITNGSISVSPVVLDDDGSNTQSIGITGDDSCLEGYTTPVILNFANPDEEPVETTTQVDDRIVTDLAITITSNDGGIVCIGQLFIGQKLFLDDDAMPDTFQNPHDGTDYEAEVKNSKCGVLSNSLQHVEVPLQLQLECLTRKFMKEKLRPYLRYAQRHGFMFQHSRNNCPEDLFVGRITGPVGPSSYQALSRNTITIQAIGHITQPQTAVYV